MAQPHNTHTNGEPASSTLILLLAWVINNMPKVALEALMNTLGLASKRTSATVLLNDILYLDTIKTFKTEARKDLHINIDEYVSALGELPFTPKTLDRKHMVRVHGWENGRSKLIESANRALKSSGDLIDGVRNYCAQCDEYMPFLGIDADIEQQCRSCGGSTTPKVREIAISNRYEPRISIPWVMNSAITQCSKVGLKTMEGNPYEAVQESLNRGVWNAHKMFVSSTVKKHSHFGRNTKGNLKAGRVYGLVCRIPVLNESGELVALWANVPCDKYGDLRAAKRFHGLCDAELKRIITFNHTLMRRSQLISILTSKRYNISANMPKEIQAFHNRYPASKSVDLRTVAKTHDLTSKVMRT